MSPASFLQRCMEHGIPYEWAVEAMRAFEEELQSVQVSRKGNVDSQDSDTRRYYAMRAEGVSPSLWQLLRERTFQRDGHVCTYCSTTEGPFEIDHIEPISRGGETHLGNLCVSCRTCNRSKKDRHVDEWRAV